MDFVGVVEQEAAVRRCRGCLVALPPPGQERRQSKWRDGKFWPLCGACARVADEADGVSDGTESGGTGGIW